MRDKPAGYTGRHEETRRRIAAAISAHYTMVACRARYRFPHFDVDAPFSQRR